MAIYAMGKIENGVASLGCDAVSDVPNLTDYAAKTHLKPGSTCLVVETSEVYVQKSDGTWATI